MRNILSRERFLRFFEDPRKEVGGLSKQGEMKRNVSRNDYSTASSNSSSNIRSETVVSGSVFVHAMSIVLRHKRELKIQPVTFNSQQVCVSSSISDLSSGLNSSDNLISGFLSRSIIEAFTAQSRTIAYKDLGLSLGTAG